MHLPQEEVGPGQCSLLSNLPPPSSYLPLTCAWWEKVKATGPRRWCVFECINQCHSLGRVVFDVKQTLWECRPCCEERLWRADGETASSRPGDLQIAGIHLSLRSFVLSRGFANISNRSAASIKLSHRCLNTAVNCVVLMVIKFWALLSLIRVHFFFFFW